LPNTAIWRHRRPVCLLVAEHLQLPATASKAGIPGQKRHNQIYHTFGLWNMGLRFSSVEVVHFAFGRLFPPPPLPRPEVELNLAFQDQIDP
jgi:hypothetical protein